MPPSDVLTVNYPLATPEEALQCRRDHIDKGGLVVEATPGKFGQSVEVHLDMTFFGRSFVVKGMVVSSTPYGTALQLTSVPEDLALFLDALDRGGHPESMDEFSENLIALGSETGSLDELLSSASLEDLAAELLDETESKRGSKTESIELLPAGDESVEEPLGETGTPGTEHPAGDSIETELEPVPDSLREPALPQDGPAASQEPQLSPEEERLLDDGESHVTPSVIFDTLPPLEEDMSRDPFGDLDDDDQDTDTDISVSDEIVFEFDMDEDEDGVSLEVETEAEADQNEDIKQHLRNISTYTAGGGPTTPGEPPPGTLWQEVTVTTDPRDPEIRAASDLGWAGALETEPPRFKGMVNGKSMNDVVRQLGSLQLTGVLRVKMVGRLLFGIWLRGRPVYFVASPPEDSGSFDEALATMPQVDVDTFEVALGNAERTGKPLGLAMVGMGIFTLDDLAMLMEREARKLAATLPLRRGGTYGFWEINVPVTGENKALDTETLLLWKF